jgi:hypothetical protein
VFSYGLDARQKSRALPFEKAVGDLLRSRSSPKAAPPPATCVSAVVDFRVPHAPGGVRTKLLSCARAARTGPEIAPKRSPNKAQALRPIGRSTQVLLASGRHERGAVFPCRLSQRRSSTRSRRSGSTNTVRSNRSHTRWPSGPAEARCTLQEASACNSQSGARTLRPPAAIEFRRASARGRAPSVQPD